MGGKRKYDYRVEPYEVDMTLRASLTSIGNGVLHTAGEDADRNGFGTRELGCSNAAWVLSRMAVELDRRPRQYERFSVTTWVSGISRIATTRNFELHDSGGSLFGAAVTLWSVIDMDSRRPLDLRGLLDCAAALCDSPSPAEVPRRLSAPSEAAAEERTVRYSDIDFNGHANSMKYLEWVADMLPVESLMEDRFARIDINYLHEARYGSRLKIVTDGAPDPLFQISSADGTPVCRIGFRRRS